MSLSKDLGEVVEYRGIEGLVAAEVLKDNNNSGEGEGYVTGEVFSIAGIAELSKSTESSNESKYYDEDIKIHVFEEYLKVSATIENEHKTSLVK